MLTTQLSATRRHPPSALAGPASRVQGRALPIQMEAPGGFLGSQQSQSRSWFSAFPGGAMSVMCEGFFSSPRIKDPLVLASSQSPSAGCPAPLCPWPWWSSLAPTSHVEGWCGSERAPAPCPLSDTPCWDGIVGGNHLSANGPFMTQTPQEHSPRVLFAVVVHLQIFPPGSWSTSSAELPLS